MRWPPRDNQTQTYTLNPAFTAGCDEITLNDYDGHADHNGYVVRITGALIIIWSDNDKFQLGLAKLLNDHQMRANALNDLFGPNEVELLRTTKWSCFDMHHHEAGGDHQEWGARIQVWCSGGLTRTVIMNVMNNNHELFRGL